MDVDVDVDVALIPNRLLRLMVPALGDSDFGRVKLLFCSREELVGPTASVF